MHSCLAWHRAYVDFARPTSRWWWWWYWTPPKRMRRNTTFPTRYNTCPPGTLLPRMGKMSLPGPNGAGKHPQELTLPKIGKQSKILPKHPWRSSPAYYGVVKISHTFKHLRICKKIIKWDWLPVTLSKDICQTFWISLPLASCQRIRSSDILSFSASRLLPPEARNAMGPALSLPLNYRLHRRGAPHRHRQRTRPDGHRRHHHPH